MRQFSIAHLAALAILVLASTLAIVLPRRYPGRWVTWAARLLAAAIFAGWVGEYVADVVLGVWTVRYSLPLQLTDAVSLTAIVALLARRRLFVELLYFWSFSASLQAMLTPRPRLHVPERVLFHVLHLPRRLDRGSVPAGVRLPAVSTPRRDLARVRDHVGIRGGRGHR
jgi:hypothetical integral membrane protein (TIGR02206 family)